MDAPMRRASGCADGGAHRCSAHTARGHCPKDSAGGGAPARSLARSGITRIQAEGAESDKPQLQEMVFFIGSSGESILSIRRYGWTEISARHSSKIEEVAPRIWPAFLEPIQPIFLFENTETDPASSRRSRA